MGRPGTPGGQGAVGPFRAEVSGPAPPEVQGLPDHPQLGKSFVGPGQDVFRGEPRQFVEESPAPVEVHRPPVVRVHQAQVPEFRSLVEIGDARRREFQEGLGQAVDSSGGHEIRDEFFQVAAEFFVGHHAVHEVRQSLFVGPVPPDPGRVRLGLPDRLLHVSLHPLFVDGPGPDEGLVKEVLGVAIGCAVPPMAFVTAGPAAHRFGPSVRDLRKEGQPGADILASLGVVGRRGEKGKGPVLPGVGARLVKLLGGNAEEARVAPHLVEPRQAVVAVKGRVLHALGHGRAGELLEPERQVLFQGAVEAQEEQVLEKPEEPGVEIGPFLLRPFHGPGDAAPVGGAHRLCGG